MNSLIQNNKPIIGIFGIVFIISLVPAVLLDQTYLLAFPFITLIFYNGWQNSIWLFFLLLIALPFSFEYNFTASLGTDIPDEGLMLLLTVTCIAYWIYQPSIVSKQALTHPLLVLLIVHIGWIITTTVFSTHPLLSVKFLIAKTWYAGAFVLAPIILLRNKRLITNAAILLSVSVVIVAIISLYRHWTYNFSFITVNQSVSPFFRNHVNYSSMLVCVIPVLGCMYYLAEKKQHRTNLAVAIIVLLAAIFFSYARGAWLALCIGILAGWLIRKKLLGLFYVGAIVLVTAAVFWLKTNDRYLRFAHDYNTTIFHQDFRQHLVATYKLKDVSTAERFYRWIAGIRMVQERPLTGFGPSSFHENYKPYAIPAFKTWVSNNPEHSTVHNYYLLVLIEQGVTGIIIFLVLLGALFYYAQHLYHRVADPFYRAVALTTGAMLAMIATVNFLSDLVETDKVGSLFFLGLAILIITDVNTRKKQERVISNE